MTSILEFYSTPDPEAGISRNSTSIRLNFSEKSISELKENLIHAGSCLSDTLSEIWDAPVMWRLAHCTDFPELCEDKDFKKFSDICASPDFESFTNSKIKDFDKFSKNMLELEESTNKAKSIFTEFRGFPVSISPDNRLGRQGDWYGSFGSKVLVHEASTRAEAVESLIAAMKLEFKKFGKVLKK